MWSSSNNGMSSTRRGIDRDNDKMGWAQTPPLDVQRDPIERTTSAQNLRSAFRATLSPSGTIRAVTPEPTESARGAGAGAGASSSGIGGGSGNVVTGSDAGGYQDYSSKSQQSSPRSIPAAPARRQGIVFEDAALGIPLESGSGSGSVGGGGSSPPNRKQRRGSGSLRPRTRTMDTSMLSQRSMPPASDPRNRVGSVSSSGSQQHPNEDSSRPPPLTLESMGYTSAPSGRASDPTPRSTAFKDKKSSNKRLVKRQTSRPTSPLPSVPPCVDSLPLPIPTDDANKVILLMKTLCGRMRGDIEYQGESGGPWHAGVAYIDDEKGCLMFDSGQNGPFHIPIVSDLRGCRVLPVDYPEVNKECIEVVCMNPPVEILVCPMIPEELELWLAALLCWQQLRPMSVKLTYGKPTSPVRPVRPELRRHGWSNEGTKPTTIIKVGKLMLWDKGLAVSPRAIVKRPSTRDLRSPTTAWRRVSCILQDNGEFKLLTENDASVLSIIELSQLSRCAIQQLDRTVLDEEHCIAIFPTYAATSTHLSIFRPIYLAFDSRVNFEVWFVLLRAFAVPDIYRLDDPSNDDLLELTDIETEYEGEVFRLEKTINVRVTEAKVRAQPTVVDPSVVSERSEKLESVKSDKHSKKDREREKLHEKEMARREFEREQQDPLVGNYLAEVILDGEIRARTTTKTGTKNPFWREECEFTDLPPSMPLLSVVLKRVEGNFESYGNLLQASVGLPKTGNLQEVICGAVDIPLDQPERSKDSEQWLQIYDEKQQSIGSMLIKVTHDEHVVLLSKEYNALSEVLHRFPSGLTMQIASVLSGQLRRLAELFLNIFQTSGSASEWLMALVEDEIDGIGSQATIKKYRFSSRIKSSESLETGGDRELIVRDMGKSLAGEANLLFRGNSLLTQALEFHMRRLGKEYLEEVLQDKILEINEINPDCEVDPSKIPPGGDLETHWTQLIQLTTEIWQCICRSAHRIPPEIRHILKYIRAVADDRYSDFLRTVTYTSVSGFLFLRFICPAILSPKLFNLLRDHPRPRAQRTFTLIAKALQKLANLSNFGKREEWMEPMNRFLNMQRQSIREFIDEVCSIPAERGGNSSVTSGSGSNNNNNKTNNNNWAPAYSTPITIMGRLSPTGKEGFPSLPYLIDSARNFASLVKLWVDAKPMNPKQDDMDGDSEIVLFNDLCFALQQRADACHAKVETVRAAESEMAASDELAESLEQATLIESLSISYGGGGSSSSTAWNDMMMMDRGTPGSSEGESSPAEGSSSQSYSHRHHYHRHKESSRLTREGWETRRALRHVSTNSHGSKGKNPKVGRTLLNGIMRMGGRYEGPEMKGPNK